MKKTILFGSILSVFILLTIPNISAIEHQTRNEVIESKIDKIFSRPILDDYDWAEELLHNTIFKIINGTYNFISNGMNRIIDDPYSIFIIQFLASVFILTLFFGFQYFMTETYYNMISFIDYGNENYSPMKDFALTLLSIPFFIFQAYFNLFYGAFLGLPIIFFLLFAGLLLQDYDFPPFIEFILNILQKIQELFDFSIC